MLETMKAHDRKIMEAKATRLIVVTGAHGVGKTTLVHDLAEKANLVRKVAVIPETARLLVERGISVNDNITVDGCLEYIRTYLLNKRMANAQLLISDRSIFDLYVYTRGLFPDKLPVALEGVMKELIIAEVNEVARFVYVPIEFDMTQDGVRPFEISYQQEIDQVVRRTFDEFGIQPVVAAGTPQQRMEIVTSEINALFQKT